MKSPIQIAEESLKYRCETARLVLECFESEKEHLLNFEYSQTNIDERLLELTTAIDKLREKVEA